MDYKSNFKEDLRGTTFEELIKEFKSLKNELLYMEECINDNNISYEQKSEFLNVDIPNAKENLEIIEEVINERKGK